MQHIKFKFQTINWSLTDIKITNQRSQSFISERHFLENMKFKLLFPLLDSLEFINSDLGSESMNRSNKRKTPETSSHVANYSGSSQQSEL